MPSLNPVLLLVTALILAAGNVWFAAARSLIPLALNDRIENVEMRREKHPGKDDVYLLTLDSGRVLQIDRPIAEAIAVGGRIEKAAWSRALQVDSRAVELEWSRDFRGMIKAMPAILLVVIATSAWVRSSLAKSGG